MEEVEPNKEIDKKLYARCMANNVATLGGTLFALVGSLETMLIFMEKISYRPHPFIEIAVGLGLYLLSSTGKETYNQYIYTQKYLKDNTGEIKPSFYAGGVDEIYCNRVGIRMAVKDFRREESKTVLSTP